MPLGKRAFQWFQFIDCKTGPISIQRNEWDACAQQNNFRRVRARPSYWHISQRALTGRTRYQIAVNRPWTELSGIALAGRASAIAVPSKSPAFRACDARHQSWPLVLTVRPWTVRSPVTIARQLDVAGGVPEGMNRKGAHLAII